MTDFIRDKMFPNFSKQTRLKEIIIENPEAYAQNWSRDTENKIY